MTTTKITKTMELILRRCAEGSIHWSDPAIRGPGMVSATRSLMARGLLSIDTTRDGCVTTYNGPFAVTPDGRKALGI